MLYRLNPRSNFSTKYLGHNNENSPFLRVTCCKQKRADINNLSTCYFILGTDGKDMETKSGQEKILWSNAMIDDMIHIMCSDEILKKKLIFEIRSSPPM